MEYKNHMQYQRKCKIRERILVVGILLTMLVRYFGAALFLEKQWLRQCLQPFTLYDTVEKITYFVVFVLEVAGLIVYLVDFVCVARRTDIGNRCMLVVIWLLFRPAYFAMRAKVIKDESGWKKGVVYGILYAVLMMIHIWNTIEAIVFSIAITG